MPRPLNKEKLLVDGLRLVHKRGSGASSVRDITQAAGVPQGSFTNHFAMAQLAYEGDSGPEVAYRIEHFKSRA